MLMRSYFDAQWPKRREARSPCWKAERRPWSGRKSDTRDRHGGWRASHMSIPTRWGQRRQAPGCSWHGATRACFPSTSRRSGGTRPKAPGRDFIRRVARRVGQTCRRSASTCIHSGGRSFGPFSPVRGNGAATDWEHPLWLRHELVGASVPRALDRRPHRGNGARGDCCSAPTTPMLRSTRQWMGPMDRGRSG